MNPFVSLSQNVVEHPGLVFSREFLITGKVTLAKIGELPKQTRHVLSAMVIGQQRVTGFLAMILQELTGVEAEAWRNMQEQYDQNHAVFGSV